MDELNLKILQTTRENTCSLYMLFIVESLIYKY